MRSRPHQHRVDRRTGSLRWTLLREVPWMLPRPAAAAGVMPPELPPPPPMTTTTTMSTGMNQTAGQFERRPVH